MDNIEIRSATLTDLPILYKFEQAIIKAERPFDVTLKPDPINYYDLKELVLSSDAEVVVAVDDGKVVASGYVKIKVAKDYFKHHQYAYLGFMYVASEHRGKGINRRIIDALMIWSKSKNLKEVRLNVYDENSAAIRAYQKSGFQKQIVEMRMSLD